MFGQGRGGEGDVGGWRQQGRGLEYVWGGFLAGFAPGRNEAGQTAEVKV